MESEFIWFIDQDDYLIKNETFDIILDSFSTEIIQSAKEEE